MVRHKVVGGLFVLLLLSASLIMFSLFADSYIPPENEVPTFSRGESGTSYTYSNRTVVWSSAPEAVLVDGKWQDYSCIRDDVNKCYRVRVAGIGAIISDSMEISYYDPDMKEFRAKEAWVIHDESSGTFYGLSGSWSISEESNDSGVYLTASEVNALLGNISLIFWFQTGGKLKHTFIWQSAVDMVASVKQVWTLPKSVTSMVTDKGVDEVKAAHYTMSTYFEFKNGSKPWIFEDQSSTQDNLLPTTVFLAIGQVAYTFGNYTVSASETVTIDPTTFTGQVGTNTGYDAKVYETGSGHPPWDAMDTSNGYFGYYSGDTNYYGIAAVFQSVTIAKGSTINSAYFSVCCSSTNGGATCNARLCAQNADTTGVFSDVTDYNDRSRTAYVAWNSVASFTANAWYNSTDIAAAVQTVVNRAGWASGNNLCIFCEDAGTSTTLRYVYDYGQSSTKCEKIYITYTVPDATAPTATVPAAPYNTTIAGAVANFSCQWSDETALSKATLETNNTGSLANQTWIALSGVGPSWANFTVTLNATAGRVIQYKWYCNDTTNNMAQTNTTGVYMTLTLTSSDTSAPTYSLPATPYNTTIAGNAARFDCQWNDNTNVTTSYFCTNNTGVWVNASVTMSWTNTTSAWANYTITLNSTIGVVVQYLWNASDAVPNWNTTMTAQSVTTTFYGSITVITTSHSWSAQPGNTHVLLTEGLINVTVTSNADFQIQVRSESANLVSGSYNLAVSNIEASKDAIVYGLGFWVNLNTTYQTIPGSQYGYSHGTNVVFTFLMWLSVPAGTRAGTYTYTLDIQVIQA